VTATAWALAGHDDHLLAAVAAVLRDAGVAAYRVDDTPGLVVSRILSMIVNEACEAEQQGVATAGDIDTAMVLATNYPSGPFSWMRTWGPATVRDILDNVWAAYRDPRYRCSRRLRVHAGS
jgi:3-hydroxybutyryl-CoA dehydrogenase